MVTHARTKSEKQALGAFYTPYYISQILTEWAIRSPNEHTLEPSFGGCGFIEAAADRLITLSNRKPFEHIYGCDIDEKAFSYLSRLKAPLSVGFDKRYLHEDFLTLSNNSFKKKKFDSVIGNPPYIAFKNLNKQQKYIADLLTTYWFKRKSVKPNIWMLFILQSLSFLKPGSRIAFVLPRSAMKADYAQPMFSLISRGFEKSLLLPIGESMFRQQGTGEKCLLLLADGWRDQAYDKRNLCVKFCNKITDIHHEISLWDNGVLSPRHSNDLALSSKLSGNEQLTYNRLSLLSTTKVIGDIIDIKIGAVTGDKNFFVLNEESRKKHKLHSNFFRFVISSTIDLPDIEINKANCERLKETNSQCLMLYPSDKQLDSKPLSKYLNSYSKEKFEKNQTFKKRPNWYRVELSKAPDLFLSSFSNSYFRLSVNTAKVDCINNIHRLYLRNKTNKIGKMALLLSFYSSLTQLSIEIEGRHYGSGAIKLEPSDFKKLKIITPENYSDEVVAYYINRLKKCLNKNDYLGAQDIANEWLTTCTSLTKRELKTLKEGYIKYVDARKG